MQKILLKQARSLATSKEAKEAVRQYEAKHPQAIQQKVNYMHQLKVFEWWSSLRLLKTAKCITLKSLLVHRYKTWSYMPWMPQRSDVSKKCYLLFCWRHWLQCSSEPWAGMLSWTVEQWNTLKNWVLICLRHSRDIFPLLEKTRHNAHLRAVFGHYKYMLQVTKPRQPSKAEEENRLKKATTQQTTIPNLGLMWVLFTWYMYKMYNNLLFNSPVFSII